MLSNWARSPTDSCRIRRRRPAALLRGTARSLRQRLSRRPEARASATAGSREARAYQDNRTWQRGDKGYNRSYGDAERYRQQFRDRVLGRLPDGYAHARYSGYGNGRAVPRQDVYGYPGVYGNSYPTATPIPITASRALTATTATPTARRIRTG